MKCLRLSLAPILLLAGIATCLSAVPVRAQAGVTIQIGQPGYYGPVSPYGIGRNQLLYPQPVMVQPGYGNRGPSVNVQPLYLRVPPGQAKNWRNNCQRYGACNRPVYFVQDSWYNETYGQRYRQQHNHN
jgi:hypothetical protein